MKESQKNVHFCSNVQNHHVSEPDKIKTQMITNTPKGSIPHFPQRGKKENFKN